MKIYIHFHIHVYIWIVLLSSFRSQECATIQLSRLQAHDLISDSTLNTGELKWIYLIYTCCIQKRHKTHLNGHGKETYLRNCSPGLEEIFWSGYGWGCGELSLIVTLPMMSRIVQQNWTHFTWDLIQSSTHRYAHFSCVRQNMVLHVIKYIFIQNNLRDAIQV